MSLKCPWPLCEKSGEGQKRFSLPMRAELLLLDKLFHQPTSLILLLAGPHFPPSFTTFYGRTNSVPARKLIMVFQGRQAENLKAFWFQIFAPREVKKVNFDAIVVVPRSCATTTAIEVNYGTRKPLCWPKIPHRGIFFSFPKGRPTTEQRGKEKQKKSK